MKPIGAFATILWHGEKEPVSGYYFSFGEMLEDYEVDSYGVADFNIFYYCEGEEDLKSLMEKGLDFIILSYELEYR